MASLNEIIYSIKENFSNYSDDSLLSNEYLAFLIKTKRATYLRNLLSNLKRTIPLEVKQQICLELTEDEICEDGWIFLKSIEKLPQTIEATGRSNISNFYLNSRISKWLNVIEYERIPYLKSGRFNFNQIYLTVDPEGYVILYSPSGNHILIEEIKLDIVAEDPELAYQLQCNNNECEYYETNFPMEASMISDVRVEILNELLVKYKIPVDVINNAEDDTANSNKLNARTRL